MMEGDTLRQEMNDHYYFVCMTDEKLREDRRFLPCIFLHEDSIL